MKRFLFKPYNCTDFDIFFRYNSKLKLPRCFRKLKGVQKRCRCFKELEVFYNAANPLAYVCRMKRILKNTANFRNMIIWLRFSQTKVLASPKLRT